MESGSAAARRLLGLNAVSHLLVDALCAATVFGSAAAADANMIVLYNTLAFSTQCLVGLAADRIRKHGLSAALSMLLVVLGYALPLPVWVRVSCIGLGNSLFHVVGGSMTLEQSRGKAGALGVFVAPGAIGVTLGTLWPKLGTVLAILLTLCAILEVPLSRSVPAERQEQSTEGSLLIPVLLTAAVAVRAVGGSAVHFPWKVGIPAALVMTGFVFLGKTLGGFVCDRIGAKNSAWISIVPAAVLIAFCSNWAVPALAGQFLINLTMPVTLWLLYRAMPDAPGFAFGLAASALWPGAVLGGLMTLTGPVLWLCVVLSFLYGLWAILYSEKKIFERKDEPHEKAR